MMSVLKGACDGGLNVPHKTKRFPGYVRGGVHEVVNKRGKATGELERTEAKFDAKVLRPRPHLRRACQQLHERVEEVRR